MSRSLTFALLTSATLVLFAMLLSPALVAQSEEPDDHTIFLPLIRVVDQPLTSTPSPQPSMTPVPNLEWDPRLDQRGARLILATVVPGEHYWRLIRARWYNTEEAAGRHHIYMDTLDATGARQSGVPLLVSWPEGSTQLESQAKPDEEYAADFAMFSLAPAYAARPNDDAPADSVDGMGLGEIDDPFRAHHTSYGLVWQWTQAPTLTATPTATATTTATATVTATVTPIPSATPTPDPALSFDALYAGCTANANATRIEGVVYVEGIAADGWRVVFSWQPDGPWITPPAVSGPTPPGAYTHLVSERTGDWWVWMVDDEGTRISNMASFASGGACNIGKIDFFKR